MDLDVTDVSIGSLLRRVGGSASPLSNPSSASPRRRPADRQRPTTPLVRAAILHRAAADQRRSQADTSMEQFVRDQELALDGSVDSVDLDMSGSPGTRARSFLAHQRRSLSGDELARLMRELRTPATRSGRRRVSVGVSQRHLAALGDDGVQALLELVDDGLEEFEGTMSASIEEEDTLTSSPSSEAGAAADGKVDGRDRQEDQHASGGDNAVMEESAEKSGGDGREEPNEERDNEKTGVEGELEGGSPEQDAEVMDEGNPEQAVDMEQDVNEERFDVAEDGDEQGASVAAGDASRSSGDQSRRLRMSSNVPAQAPGDWDRSGTLTPRASIRRTPVLKIRRVTPPGDRVITPSSTGRGRLSQSRNTPVSPSRRAPLHKTPPTAERREARAAAAASSSKDGSITPASRAPLRSVTPRTAGGRRTPASAVRSGGQRMAGSGSRVSRAGLSGELSGGGSPLLRESSGPSRTPPSGGHRKADAAEPAPEDVQAGGDAAGADDEPFDGDTGFDTPLPPPLARAAPRGSTSGARSGLVTPQPKATPGGGSVRKKYGSAFEKFFAAGRRGQTSTPMSEPPRRAAEAAQPSPHSKSLFVAAVSPQRRTPGRLSLVRDKDFQPTPRFTSGLIDDPDEAGSDVSEEFPSEAGGAAGSPRLRSAGSGRLSQLSAGSRAAGTPFVPSAESTRLSLRPTGAPSPADAADTVDEDSTDTVIRDPSAAGVSARSLGAAAGVSARSLGAAAGVSARSLGAAAGVSARSLGAAAGVSARSLGAAAGVSARSPATAVADRSSASAASPSKLRSLRASFADGATPGQERPASAADASRSQPKSATKRPAAAAGKLSAREAFARMFPNYEQDKQQQQQREAAAAKRHRSLVTHRSTKRSSLFVPLKTRRWFKQHAVGLRVTPEALQEVDASMEKYERMVRGWLREVTGPSREPTQSDVLAVVRRSGVAGTEPELRQLIRKHYPREEQQQLIRVAECGRLYPADNPLAED